MFSKYIGDQTLASKLDGPGFDPANPKFFYSITRDSAKKRLYLKVVNASSTPQPLEVDFAGAKLAPTGKLISLSAHDTQATNTLAKPTEIVPVETPLPGVNDHLHHTVPGYAIQIVQVDEQ
jgi:alpha-N-arabinofuranosidase